MKRRISILVMAALFTSLFSGSIIASAASSAYNAEQYLNIATVDNRPLYIDRLLYTAFKDINYQVSVTTAASLQQGYVLANNDERDGVISSTPNMEQLYPNLRRVPVALEDNDFNAYARADSGIVINDWKDLSGLRVGILTQRVYIENQLLDNVTKTAKENTRLLMEGLVQNEYDVVVYSKRAHESLKLPDNVVFAGQMESLPEYLYVHKNLAYLIPDITDALNNVFADGRGENILCDIPIPEAYPKKTVLHIISSDAETSRENQFITTIKEQLIDDMSIEWYSISLNSKRFSGDPNRLAYFANLLRQDCVSKNIASIIVSGEDALGFIKEYYFRFFRDVPVLFYGVGDNYEESILDFEPYFTGVVERLSAFETVSAALEIFPDTKNLYVVNDYSTEGKNYRASIEEQMEPFSDTLNITYNENIGRDSLLEQIRNLPQDSLVFIGSYFLDVNGQYFSQSDMKWAMERECKVPVIALYSTEVPYNAIGGKCLDYEKYGGEIASMLKRLLNGEDVGDMPVIADSAGYNRWVFDINIMARFNVGEASLPKGSLITNKRPSVWESNPKFAFGMVIIFIIIIAAGALALFHEHNKNKIRRAEEIYQKQRVKELKYAAAIMDNLSEMIYVTDINYNLLYANREVAFAYNVDADIDIYLNKKCYEVFFESQTGPCQFCHLPELLEKKEELPSVDWEGIAGDPDVWLSGRTSIVRWVDGSLAQISTCKDDTLRKTYDTKQKQNAEKLREAAEFAEESSRLKTVFLANMSHEIRTPMNGIIGFSELALDDSIMTRTRDYLNKIKSSAEGLLQIINDILDISKIEVGKMNLENTPFSLSEVFKDCQTITSPKAMEKGISLFCYAEPSVGKKLLGDPTRLRQAILNLLSNAVKFTNSGVVKLLSSVEQTDGDSITIRFEVKDSGIGMTPEQIGRIFEPFTQANDSTTRKYGGTGLGLSITKSVVELMGGELNVESVAGVGSKFGFTLTFKTIDKPATAAGSEIVTDKLEKPTFNGEILVCEDNAMNQEVICDHLSRVGLRSTVANNGRVCVDLVAGRMERGEPPFDLIFMDIHMPVMDGLEAAQNLIRIGNKTPIVALTANIMSSDREAYRAHGIPDYIAKPFTARELWSCLLRYIKPVGRETVDNKEQNAADEKLYKRMRINFVKDHKTAFSDIAADIEAGDLKRAHLRAHTLKGVSGLIGKTGLQEAANVIERSLAEGKVTFTREQMSALEHELNAVLAELAPLLDESTPRMERTKDFDKIKALGLIERLGPLIDSSDTDCLDFVDELVAIPGTEALIEQIERFDFTLAGKTLANVKQSLEV